MVSWSLGEPMWTQLAAGVLEWDLVWFLEWPGKIQEIHQIRLCNFFDRCRELLSEHMLLLCNGRLQYSMCLMIVFYLPSRIFATSLCSLHRASCDWGHQDLSVVDLAQVPAALMQELVVGLEQAFPLAWTPPENECSSAYDAHCHPIHIPSSCWENKTRKVQKFLLDILHLWKKPKNHFLLLHTHH